LTNHLCIANQISDSKRRQSMLSRAKEIARPAQFKVDFGEFKTIGRLRKRFEPLLSFFAGRLGKNT
jgi:hypothetical protein